MLYMFLRFCCRCSAAGFHWQQEYVGQDYLLCVAALSQLPIVLGD